MNLRSVFREKEDSEVTMKLNKSATIKLTVLISVICSVVFLGGCAGFKETVNKVWSDMRGETGGTQTGAREEAVRRYNYQNLKDEVFVETPKVVPNVVSPGTEIKQEVVFAVLSPRPEATFAVLEVITLMGRDISIELSRKSADKAQGVHVSTVTFLIPKDLPRGTYRLITSIGANGLEGKQTGSFTVR